MNTEANNPGIKVEPFYATIREVTKITAIGKSKIATLEKNGQFPKRISINSARVIWPVSDIYNWCKLVQKLKSYPPEGHYDPATDSV